MSLELSVLDCDLDFRGAIATLSFWVSFYSKLSLNQSGFVLCASDISAAEFSCYIFIIGICVIVRLLCKRESCNDFSSDS